MVILRTGVLVSISRPRRMSVRTPSRSNESICSCDKVVDDIAGVHRKIATWEYRRKRYSQHATARRTCTLQRRDRKGTRCLLLFAMVQKSEISIFDFLSAVLHVVLVKFDFRFSTFSTFNVLTTALRLTP